MLQVHSRTSQRAALSAWLALWRYSLSKDNTMVSSWCQSGYDPPSPVAEPLPTFAAYLVRVAPPHYLPFYIDYRRLKAEIRRIGLRAKAQEAQLNAKLRPRRHSAVELPTLVAPGPRAYVGGSLRAEAELLREQPVVACRELLEAELRKVNRFAQTQLQNITQSLQAIAAQMKRLSVLAGEQYGFELEKLEQYLDEDAAEIVHLDQYIRVNFNAASRLILLMDESLPGRGVKSGSSGGCRSWFLATLRREEFANVDIDRLLILLSLAWATFRAAKKSKSLSKESLWRPPESFVRSTTKYWLLPDRVVRAKVSILRRLPYLIFGASERDLEVMLNPYSAAAYPTLQVKDVTESQSISSVYLDSPDAYCYRRRILRYEGAELVRVRWYGENNSEPSKTMFAERKTHHERWSGEDSVKDRFQLSQADVRLLLAGCLDVRECVARQCQADGADACGPKALRSAELGEEIADVIARRNLQPMIRTSYLRAAFQEVSTDAVRISLERCRYFWLTSLMPTPARPPNLGVKSRKIFLE
eukprot:GHVT01009191.1.p1 GENE.GHVT01009191.1~~GHVT01009191.1.p1  ORF type:complete len:530 (-),score=121.02 GHVT01009191.1:622-2211(-)